MMTMLVIMMMVDGGVGGSIRIFSFYIVLCYLTLWATHPIAIHVFTYIVGKNM
jgi:hypothetical protein